MKKETFVKLVTNKPSLLVEALEVNEEATLIFDQADQLVHYNKKTLSLFNYQEGDIKIAMSLKDVIKLNLKSAGYISFVAQEFFIKQLDEIQSKVCSDNIYKQPNGRIIQIKSHKIPQNGLVLKYEDITLRLRKESDMTNREHQYRNFLDISPMAGMIVDFDGKLIYSNNSFNKLIGYQETKPLKHKSVAEIFMHKDELEDYFNPMHINFSPLCLKVKIRHQDGNEIECRLNIKRADFQNRDAYLCWLDTRSPL